MLIERSAVEAREREGVGGKVARHPVKDYADPPAMKIVDEKAEVVGAAETRGGREVAAHLVAPRAAERMLHHGHQLDVGEAEFGHVVGERGSQLAVSEPAVALLGDPPPRAEVDLVD